MRLTDVTLDFENYFAVGYTLKGSNALPTSEFVRDPRFHVHGLGIQVNDENPYWVNREEVPYALTQFNWGATRVIAHHAHYDGFILSQHYGVYPAIFGCTLSLSRAVHQGLITNDLNTIMAHYGLKTKSAALHNIKGKKELTHEELTELADYCLNDVSGTRTFWNLRSGDLPPEELELIDLTVKLFTDPVLQVDYARAEAERIREENAQQALIDNCGATREILSSNPKFADYLRSIGVTPPTKLNKKGKETYAFAKNDISFQRLRNKPELRDLIDARIAVKSTITTTRATRLINHCPKGSALPIYLKYWGAHTGRWSGGDKLNPQNFSRGGELRKSILAAMGFLLVVGDLSQIEARTLAWWARCKSLVEAFANGIDIYSEFASSVFGYPVNRKTKIIDEEGNETYPHFIEGFVGKVCILGLGYGMGPPKFRDTLASGSMGAVVILEDNKEFESVTLYRSTYKQIPGLWHENDKMLACMCAPEPHPSGMFHIDKNAPHPEYEVNGVFYTRRNDCGVVRLPSGRELLYPDLQVTDDGTSYKYRDGKEWKFLWGGTLVENIVQAMARDIIAEQMLELNQYYRVVLSTHDELVLHVPERESSAAHALMMHIMSTAKSWYKDIPLAAEGGYAREYSK